MTDQNNRSILAAMAGYTDGSFAAKCLFEGGAGMVTLGGIPIGKSMIESSIKLIKRGRKEFLPHNGEEINFLNEELKHFPSLSSIILNLRLKHGIDAEYIASALYTEYSELPLVEINAHCRQKEVIELGGGQNLLARISELQMIIEAFYSKDFQISLKIRGNAIKPEKLIPEIKRWPLNYLHIDSYLEGIDGTDLNLITHYSNNIEIPIIGNNSVKDFKSAAAILSAGASFFSIARASLVNYKIFGQILKDF